MGAFENQCSEMSKEVLIEMLGTSFGARDLLQAEVSRLTGENEKLHADARSGWAGYPNSLERERDAAIAERDSLLDRSAVVSGRHRNEASRGMGEVYRHHTGKAEIAVVLVQLAESVLAVAFADRDAALAKVAELRGGLEMTTKCLIDLAPYGPDVAEGVIAIVGVARALLASAPEVKGEDEWIPCDAPAPSVGMVTREEHEKEIADKVQDAMRNEAELHDRLVSTLADNAALVGALKRVQERAARTPGMMDVLFITEPAVYESHPGAALLDEVERLRAKVARLTARGIEDLRHENATLADAVRKAKEAAVNWRDWTQESHARLLADLTKALDGGGGK